MGELLCKVCPALSSAAQGGSFSQEGKEFLLMVITGFQCGTAIAGGGVLSGTGIGVSLALGVLYSGRNLILTDLFLHSM